MTTGRCFQLQLGENRNKMVSCKKYTSVWSGWRQEGHSAIKFMLQFMNVSCVGYE